MAALPISPPPPSLSPTPPPLEVALLGYRLKRPPLPASFSPTWLHVDGALLRAPSSHAARRLGAHNPISGTASTSDANAASPLVSLISTSWTRSRDGHNTTAPPGMPRRPGGAAAATPSSLRRLLLLREAALAPLHADPGSLLANLAQAMARVGPSSPGLLHCWC